jgi:hypothetical protein
VGLLPVPDFPYPVHTPIPPPQQLGKLGLGWVRVVCHACKLQYDVDQIEHYRHPRVLHVSSLCAPEDTSPQAAGCLHRWMTSQRRTSAGSLLSRDRTTWVRAAQSIVGTGEGATWAKPGGARSRCYRTRIVNQEWQSTELNEESLRFFFLLSLRPGSSMALRVLDRRKCLERGLGE